ncbi:MAG: ABC transporter permease [Sphingobacteriales bacterium]
MMYFKLAWRNMWRSRRRTLITVSSIFFAVIFAILMRVAIVGLFDKLIADTVSMSSGYIQVHHSGYWESKSVDSTFEQSPKLASILNREKEVTAWTPRLETFALASSGERTKGVLVTGIDPQKENSVSSLSRKIISGRYLSAGDKGVILGQGLAAYLRLKVNDTIVLIGQGFQGNMASGKYAIRGIVKLGIPEMNKGMAWLPMAQTQDFLSTGPRYTSISLQINDRDKLDELKQRLIKQTKGDSYEVMTWKEMIPELDQLFQAKMAQNVIMSGVLYLVIAFGILGTILMMLNERLHEFGILIAIGMKKNLLAGVVVIEMVLMSVVGTVLGAVCIYPVVLYYHIHPIRLSGDMAKDTENYNIEPVIQMSTGLSNFIIQGYVVLMIAILLSLYAIFKIHKIKVIEAINS